MVCILLSKSRTWSLAECQEGQRPRPSISHGLVKEKEIIMKFLLQVDLIAFDIQPLLRQVARNVDHLFDSDKSSLRNAGPILNSLGNTCVVS